MSRDSYLKHSVKYFTQILHKEAQLYYSLATQKGSIEVENRLDKDSTGSKAIVLAKESDFNIVPMDINLTTGLNGIETMQVI
jgi:hypothetical protein